MHKAPFVVVEGIDGAGTTTQTRRLVEGLRRRSIQARETREPTDGPIGMLLRQMLKGRVIGASGGAPGWQELALLFAADRIEHAAAEIEPLREAGTWVVSDRYDYSSVAYQSATAGDLAVIPWLKAINGQAPRPDLTIVINVSPEVARERRNARGSAKEIFDEDPFQAKLAAFYRDIDWYFPDDRIVHIDGDADADRVFEALFACVLQLEPSQ